MSNRIHIFLFQVPYTFHSEEDLKKWVVTADERFQLGLSRASLQLTKYKTGVFSGFVDATNKEGDHTKCGGFVNIQALYDRVRY